jgi:hypothetical protein
MFRQMFGRDRLALFDISLFLLISVQDIKELLVLVGLALESILKLQEMTSAKSQ